MEGNIVDELIDGDLEVLEIDLSCDPDPFLGNVGSPSPSP
jgi:hypothetical protein